MRDHGVSQKGGLRRVLTDFVRVEVDIRWSWQGLGRNCKLVNCQNSRWSYLQNIQILANIILWSYFGTDGSKITRNKNLTLANPR